MGCFGEREKIEDARAEQKWDYIKLGDFKSTSCYSPLSYGILYLLLVISVAVYAVDLFTAANLLFFNRWSGQVKPVISFKIARWIFAGCIIITWILLVHRWVRAMRVMKSGVVAANYLDPLAVKIQSIRTGPRGRGWRRFLVFAALTKERKGTEYVALFTYFSFEAWLRIVFADGPRQIINALTLYSVMQADLLPAGKHTAKDGHSPISQFWINISILANHNREQAAILFGMLFTLIIWVFSALGLLVACLMYIIFLWHHIPDNDGTLARFCRRKVDGRLAKIVGVKVKKALAKEDAIRAKKAAKDGERPERVKRQPTLPIMTDESQQDLTPGSLSRQTTATTLESQASYPSSVYRSHQITALGRQPAIPRNSMNVDQLSGPSRSTTQTSVRSANSSGSDVPLIGSAAPLGRSAPKHNNSRPPSSPTGYGQCQQNGGLSIPRKPLKNSEDGRPLYNSPWPSTLDNRTLKNLPPRPAAQNVDISGHEPSIKPQSNMLAYHDSYVGNDGRRKPARGPFPPPPMQGQQKQQEMVFRPTLPPPPPSSRNPPGNNSSYIAYNPLLHGPQGAQQAGAAPTLPVQFSAPSRNLALPSRSIQDDYFSPRPPATLPPPRSGTAPVPQNAVYGGWITGVKESDHGRAPRPLILPRAATAGPDGRLWIGQEEPVYYPY